MRDKQFPKIITHICKKGDAVRVMKSETGEAWFNSVDILQSVGLSFGGHFLDRLSVFETKRIYCEGKSMRFVNSTGLLALIGTKREYFAARQIIVELIRKYSEL